MSQKLWCPEIAGRGGGGGGSMYEGYICIQNIAIANFITCIIYRNMFPENLVQACFQQVRSFTLMLMIPMLTVMLLAAVKRPNVSCTVTFKSQYKTKREEIETKSEGNSTMAVTAVMTTVPQEVSMALSKGYSTPLQRKVDPNIRNNEPKSLIVSLIVIFVQL